MKNESPEKEKLSLISFPLKILHSFFEVLSHNEKDHNCRSMERGRVSWRLLTE